MCGVAGVLYDELLLVGNLQLWTARFFSFTEKKTRRTRWQISFSAEFLAFVVWGLRLHLRIFPSKFHFHISIFIQNQPLFNHVWMQRCRKKRKIIYLSIMFRFFKISCCSVAVPFGASYFFFFWTKWIHLFCKDALNWSKVTVKTFTLLRKKI